MPQAFQSSADIDAMITRVTPAILVLLNDGVPHRRQEIVDALAGQYPKDDVVLTGKIIDGLMELDLVTGKSTTSSYALSAVTDGSLLHRRLGHSGS